MSESRAYPDLEIGLHKWDASNYMIELRLSRPDSDTDIRSVRAQTRFDFDALRRGTLDLQAYGCLLGQCLFPKQSIYDLFRSARVNAQTSDVPLRVRLFIGPSAPELHELRWESLRDPESGEALLLGENLLFSRYLSSRDWRPVRLRPRGELRALVVIANPSDLAQYGLSPVNVAEELEHAKKGLGEIAVTPLASGGSASLNNVGDNLRDNYDLLYLVCHGAVKEGIPRLWLESSDGKTEVASGLELVDRLGELSNPPRLVVLASCQSAQMSADTMGTLISLGPRLAESGVAAVLAMQGSISVQTVTRFMPVFFKELQRDGQIDRAFAAARGAVRDCPDSWMPVLFLRLKSGRVWYVPGFGAEEQSFEKWPALFDAIRSNPENPEFTSRCIPILGDSLGESFFGPRRDVASWWARKYRFPLAPYRQEALPEVAQYLAVQLAPIFPREELRRYLHDKLWERHGRSLAPELKEGRLTQLVAQAAKNYWALHPDEPYQVLANLPFDIYITTNPDSLLSEALWAVGKEPQVELCRWNEKIKTRSIYDQNPNYRPTIHQPLVYCFFGQLSDLSSLVLTEDDYFDFLIGVMSRKDVIPNVVRGALAERLLLFLGFQMDDWTFRVPFRYIMSQEGGDLREAFTHIAAQIDPDESRMLEPERARDYLEAYFQQTRFHKDVSISIYWGSVQDFARDLYLQLQKGI